ncbi:hypothetical protein MKW98_012801 [Papaver atlanticum]|uniref:PGG domain-containing protein n=1 Tax=Papaver atlanticum TaxID=357466 RepID=A0AAD4SL87_9MAGN|nr:hypothetical protein MKW98_012801 [Papaver atlanticum]
MDTIRDATRKGDAESLRRILDADPNFPLAEQKFTSFLQTPLHVAAIHGYVEFAREIVNRNPQLAMEVDSQGFTPLHLASTRYNVDMVTELLNAHPGNPGACLVPDNNGGTPLHLAAMRDDVNFMELLIGRGPGAIHQRLPNTNETILHLCVKHNKFRAMEKLVKYLVDNPANIADIPDPISVNSVDSGGNTILHLAAERKRMKMLKYLIKSDCIGADINIRNNEEVTALHMLDTHEMYDLGISCYDYHTTADLGEQSTTSKNEWLKERLNTIMIVAALIAGVAFQAVINPPGGVFQEDSKIDSITDPVMFTYYLNKVIGDYAMSEGFQSYYSHTNNLPPQETIRGNISTADDEIITYRANFVKDLLTAAKNSESYTMSMYPSYTFKKSAPGIVLEDYWWMNITSNYNSTKGGGSGFSPYLVRYAGTAILAYTSPRIYQSYILLNSLSLVVCGLTILVITFDAIKQRPSGSTASMVGYLEVLLAIAVACISLSYTIVVKTIGPPFYWYLILHSKLSGMAIGVAIIPFASFFYYLISHNPLTERHFSRLRNCLLDKPLFKRLTYMSYFRTEYFWLSVKANILYLAFLALWAFFS